MSVDSSTSPYDLVITYGVEKHVGRDKRQRTGELYARRLRNDHWQGEPVLVSQPDTIYNWYPNVNQDVREAHIDVTTHGQRQRATGVMWCHENVTKFSHVGPLDRLEPLSDRGQEALELPLEGARDRALREIGRKPRRELPRPLDVTSQPRVAGAVNLAHTPGPEGLEDLVRAEACLCRQRHAAVLWET